MSEYYCGKCDIYRNPGGSFYGKHEDLCPNCLNPMYLVDRCPGCDIDYPTIEGVEDLWGLKFHDAACKDDYHESAWADSMEA